MVDCVSLCLCAATGVGIVLQSVKDVVNELVGDGIILTDKVGASNIYWSANSIHQAKHVHGCAVLCVSVCGLAAQGVAI